MLAQRRQGVALGQHGRQLCDPPLQMEDLLRVLGGLKHLPQLPQPGTQRHRRLPIAPGNLRKRHFPVQIRTILHFPPVFSGRFPDG